MNRLLLFLFFWSGASALIYEVTWLRLLTLTFGNTADATTCMLTVFLGGIALGAWLGGKLADLFTEKLLLLYSILEIAIGFTAFLITCTLYKLPLLIGSLYHAFPEIDYLTTILRLVIASLVLLTPTILMGATTPILTKFLSLYNFPSLSFTWLYACNTLGAAFGSFFACFVGFGYLGLLGTASLATAINCAIGAIALVLFWQLFRSTKHANISGSNDQIEPILDPANIENDLPFLYTMAWLSGFTALSYEILWTRLLKFYCISTSYAFTIMISFFILGLGLGSLIYSRFLTVRKTYKQTLTNLGLAQFAAAVLCACSLILMPLSAPLMRSSADELHRIFNMALVGSILILPPATILGVIFPMIGGIVANCKNVGKSVGTIYSVNTLGCVIGALLVGYLMHTSLSSFRAFQATVIFTTIGAVITFYHNFKAQGLGMISLILLPIIWFTLTIQDPIQQAALHDKTLNVISYGEDLIGVTMVIGHPDYKELRTGSTSVSSTQLPAKRYMRMLGILPALMHNKPEDALVICFGTGTTAGAVAACENVKNLDIVELSPMVLKVANQFSSSNLQVLDQAKSHAYIDDGRNFLLKSNKLYDIMTFEPPPLIEANVVNLYSKEFYQLAKAHLKSHGIICHWVPLFYQSSTLWKMMVQSAQETFKYVSIWVPNNEEAILLASDDPLEIDVQKLQKRINSSNELRSILSEVGLENANAILSTFIIAQNSLKEYIGQSKPVTDDRPQMEFYLPYIGQSAFTWDLENATINPEKCLKDSIKLLNVDGESLDNQFLAMHLFRLRSCSIQQNHSKSEQNNYLNQVLKISPENHFYQYAKNHPDAQG